jgi:hypothetical protein
MPMPEEIAARVRELALELGAAVSDAPEEVRT